MSHFPSCSEFIDHRTTLAIHDAFELYGRPKMYSWDPRDSVSMMFAYPIGPEKQVRPKITIYGHHLELGW